MNAVLWVCQITLMLLFIMDGVLKAFQYEIAKANIPWVQEVPKGLVIFIGYVEILCSIGLVLPLAISNVSFSITISSFVLSILMLFATIFHYKRLDFHSVPIVFTLFLMALFVTVGRIYF